MKLNFVKIDLKRSLLVGFGLVALSMSGCGGSSGGGAGISTTTISSVDAAKSYISTYCASDPGYTGTVAVSYTDGTGGTLATQNGNCAAGAATFSVSRVNPSISSLTSHSSAVASNILTVNATRPLFEIAGREQGLVAVLTAGKIRLRTFVPKSLLSSTTSTPSISFTTANEVVVTILEQEIERATKVKVILGEAASSVSTAARATIFSESATSTKNATRVFDITTLASQLTSQAGVANSPVNILAKAASAVATTFANRNLSVEQANSQPTFDRVVADLASGKPVNIVTALNGGTPSASTITAVRVSTEIASSIRNASKEADRIARVTANLNKSLARTIAARAIAVSKGADATRLAKLDKQIAAKTRRLARLNSTEAASVSTKAARVQKKELASTKIQASLGTAREKLAQTKSSASAAKTSADQALDQVIDTIGDDAEGDINADKIDDVAKVVSTIADLCKSDTDLAKDLGGDLAEMSTALLAIAEESETGTDGATAGELAEAKEKTNDALKDVINVARTLDEKSAEEVVGAAIAGSSESDTALKATLKELGSNVITGVSLTDSIKAAARDENTSFDEAALLVNVASAAQELGSVIGQFIAGSNQESKTIGNFLTEIRNDSSDLGIESSDLNDIYTGVGLEAPVITKIDGSDLKVTVAQAPQTLTFFNTSLFGTQNLSFSWNIQPAGSSSQSDIASLSFVNANGNSATLSEINASGRPSIGIVVPSGFNKAFNLVLVATSSKTGSDDVISATRNVSFFADTSTVLPELDVFQNAVTLKAGFPAFFDYRAKDSLNRALSLSYGLFTDSACTAAISTGTGTVDAEGGLDAGLTASGVKGRFNVSVPGNAACAKFSLSAGSQGTTVTDTAAISVLAKSQLQLFVSAPKSFLFTTGATLPFRAFVVNNEAEAGVLTSMISLGSASATTIGTLAFTASRGFNLSTTVATEGRYSLTVLAKRGAGTDASDMASSTIEIDANVNGAKDVLNVSSLMLNSGNGNQALSLTTPVNDTLSVPGVTVAGTTTVLKFVVGFSSTTAVEGLQIKIDLTDDQGARATASLNDLAIALDGRVSGITGVTSLLANGKARDGRDTDYSSILRTLSSSGLTLTVLNSWFTGTAGSLSIDLNEIRNFLISNLAGGSTKWASELNLKGRVKVVVTFSRPNRTKPFSLKYSGADFSKIVITDVIVN